MFKTRATIEISKIEFFLVLTGLKGVMHHNNNSHSVPLDKKNIYSSHWRNSKLL